MLIHPTSCGRTLLALIALTTLAACATPDSGTDHGAHHGNGPAVSTPQPGPTQSGGAMMSGGTSGGMMGSGMMRGGAAGQMGMNHMNMNAMCAMYRDMQNAATEQKRQSMMDERMKGMTPEMRQQQLEMMRQQCK